SQTPAVMWVPLPVYLLLLGPFFYGCSCFLCPRICRCSTQTIRCMDPSSKLFCVFNCCSEIAQSVTLESIKELAFSNLLNLSEISIQNARSLRHIDRRAFNNLPNLHYLSISNTGITVFPDVTSIGSLKSDFILEICDNLHLLELPPNSFLGMTEGYVALNLYNNGIRGIHNHAFNGTKIDKLLLKNNRHLKVIHSDAFQGATGPGVLDVSATALTKLPAHGLDAVLVLSAQSAYGLKSLPPLKGLSSLREAHLTYNSHCCALLSWSTHRSRPVSLTNHLTYSLSYFSEADQDDTFQDLDFHYLELGFYRSHPIICTPEEDAFNPCEDLSGFSFLRVAIWFINILAITGNLMVLLVFFTSRTKLTVPRFLMCHLAFADLCIGVYLLIIATVDLRTRGHYSQNAIEWQTGPGCSAAGFLSVFGGELSVYTLSTITLERWHTITNALHVERHLVLTQAAGIMAAGWLLCLGMGMLPLVGVSSYTKVSMCLPMDIETPLAQAFIIIILLLNVGAFIIVCVCYVLIYLAVKNPEFPERSADTRIAKRMAVLIFTDFLCMAPISFFAISAAFKVPLITVTNSKILLVLFFPINSCANPFLYAIFTKAFRKDAYQLMNVIGCHKSKADVYRWHCCSENAIKSNLRSNNKGSQIGVNLAPKSHQELQPKDEQEIT
uniref:Lutropin-choriogonadotropic hormone receptor n=1 Tax=Cyprinodon variegatus TaxID=28743 RepID=A0A3Q2FM35_CYPVA